MSFAGQSLTHTMRIYWAAQQTPSVRFRAIRGILEISDKEFGETVESFLVTVIETDSDPVVRHEAAFTLGELMKEGKIVGVIAVAALCGIIKNETSVLVLHEVAEALAHFNGSSVIATLNRLMEHVSVDVRATAAISLDVLRNYKSVKT